MARFFGKVGFIKMEEESPGVFVEKTTEKSYYGDVYRDSKRVQNGLGINDDMNINNQISIVSDAYANNHFWNISYVIWSGAKWKVTNIEVKRPRLILTLGGVYNGQNS